MISSELESEHALVFALTERLAARGVTHLFRKLSERRSPLSDIDLYAYLGSEQLASLLAARIELFAELGHILAAYSNRFPNGDASINVLLDRGTALPPIKIDILLHAHARMAQHPHLRSAVVLLDRDGTLAALIEAMRGKTTEWRTDPDEVSRFLNRFFGASWHVLSKIHKGEGPWVLLQGFNELLAFCVLPLLHAVRQLEQPGMTPDLLYARARFGDEFGDRLYQLPVAFDRASLVRAYLGIFELYRTVAHEACAAFGVAYPAEAEAAVRRVLDVHFARELQGA